MAARKLRVGFLSTSNIGRKNAGAALQSNCVDLIAVASRDLGKAKAYAEAYGFERAYGSYEELLAAPDIDALYIPLPTTLHKQWVLKAAAAGKHVLCDKPSAPNAADLREMVAAMEDKGLQFMDGLMFQHHDRVAHMERVIRGPHAELGQIHRITSALSFLGDDEFNANNIRVKHDLEPLGCVGDLGWYTIRFSLFAAGWVLPTHVRAIAHKRTAEGVPLDVSATLTWENKPELVATFHCSFVTALRQWAEVAGVNGFLRLDDFVLNKSGGSKFTVVTKPSFIDLDRDVSGNARDVSITVPYGHQEAAMWRDFATLALSGKPENKWAKVSQQTQAVADAVMASIRANGAAVEVDGAF